MASLVFTNVKTFFGAYDVSGFSNSVTLDYAAAALKDTRMGQTTEVNKGGVKTVSFRIGGFADPASAGMEAIAFGQIGTADLPVTCAPAGGGVGDVAYFFRALQATMNTFGPHGALMPFQGTALGGGSTLDRLLRGQVFLAATPAKTASGESPIVQLGPILAGQQMYAALHVLDPVTGTLPTLDVSVKSSIAGFGSVTTRITFAQATGKTSQLLTWPYATADDYQRVDYTIGGAGASFPFLVVVGIV
jgi:hypothetical protein